MISYDEKTALVIVDVQNDFADPAGSLYVTEGEQVIPPINQEIERARAAGAATLYTQDWHPPSTPHFEKDGGIWPVHCVRETWGAAFHPDLVVDGEIVRKGVGGEDGYSGFTVKDPESGDEASTELEALLRQRGIDRVVVTGLATDYCVKATAIDAAERGFDTIVIGEATRAVNLAPDDGARALDAMRQAGVRIE